MAKPKTHRRRRRGRARTPTILQMEATECGAAALGIVLGYYGKFVPLDVLRDECGVSRDGSNALRIQKAALRHGLIGSGRRCSAREARDLEIPFLAFWQNRHFLVVEGFGRGRVYLNDPAAGRRVIEAAEFDRDFSRIALAYRPGPDFQRGGKRSAPWRAFASRFKTSRALWGMIVLAGLAMTLPSLLSVVFGKIFIDEILIGEKIDWLRPLLIAMTLTMVLRVGLLAIQLALMTRLELGMAAGDASRFLQHVLRLPLRFFHLRYAGDVASRVGSNFRVARAFAGDLGFAAVGLILAFCYGAMTFAFDPWVAAAGVSLGSLNLIALRLAARWRSEEKRKIERIQSKLSSSLAWSIQSIETIKACAGEADAMTRFTGLQARLINAKQRLGRASAALAAVPPLTGYLTGAVVLSLGGWRVMAGALTIGSLNALQALFGHFRDPLDNLVRLGSSIQELEADINRLDDVIKHPEDPIYSDRDGDGGERARLRLTGRVEVRGLRFGYNPYESPLIHDFSLTLNPGQRVALVGPSGSGKSTVGRLIAGLLEPWEGEILFDGVPVSRLDRRSITDALALVNDQPFLCYGTVRENLTLWDDTIPDADLIQAMSDAAIIDDVRRRPGGLGAQLAEDARNLSGGQRQRIEIARALARSPRILILDEASSALDPPTEHRVDQAIRGRGCACLIIAHRLSTIRDADEIIVLNRGRIVQRGTHDQLMQDERGLYHRLALDGESDIVDEDHAEPQGDEEPSRPTEDLIESHAPTAINLAKDDSRESRGDQAERRDRALIGSAIERLRDAAMRRTPIESLKSNLAPASDPLLAACRLIGAAMGIEIRDARTATASSSSSAANSASDGWLRLSAIARASEVHVRRVTLREAWASADSGPLLGFRASDGAPLALLPCKGGGYEAVDPIQGTRRRLRTRHWPQVVMPAAWVFSRSLPGRPLSKGDLLRFAGAGVTRELGWTIALGASAAALALAIPIGAGHLIDEIIPAAETDRLAWLTGLLLATMLMASWLRWAQGMTMLRIDGKLAARTLPALWDRLLRLPASFFAAQRAGDLAHRALGLDGLLTAISGASAQALLAGVFSSVNLILLFFYDARLGAAALGLIALGAAILAGLIARRNLWLREIQQAAGVSQSILLELLGGIVPIRAAAAESRAFARWAESYSVQIRAMARARRLLNRASLFQTAFPIISAMVLYMVTANLSQSISAGAFIAFNAAFFGFVNAALASIAVLMGLLEAIPVLDRVRLILDATPERSATEIEPVPLQGALSLTNVSFRYAPDASLAVRDVSIEVKPGEFAAIVGPSGSGKSTLMRLLLGFNAPEQGQVAYDGRPLGLLDIRDVRRQLGVVPQNARLKPGDLRSNVTGFAPDLTEDDAWNALRLAGLEDDARRMPMGIHTHVSEGAATLSAGQRQRLHIARALVRRPAILMLDEAASALDNPAQKRIMDHIARLRATRLVIAHRLSSIRAADRIYVMQEGAIVQQGTFLELVAQPGLFQEMARRQKV